MTFHPLLPDDGCAGTLVTRIWNPAGRGGPSVAVLRDDGVYDLSAQVPTMSTLLDAQDPAALVRHAAGVRVGGLDAVLANSDEATRDSSRAFFLAPCDLQVIKAAGVTFATSMVERVIEEKAGGDASRAEAIRAQVLAQIGTDLSAIQPGSPQALQLKEALQAQGIWSVGQLQIQASMGRKYQSLNSCEKLCCRKNSPSGCTSSASALRSARPVASLLKRTTSASMRQKRGRSRLLRWAGC